jgi:succinate dehydrogenase/fumarate reductase cytochrome b subunit
MNNFGYALDGAWQVLLAGLVLGAGLPAVFALGIRSLAWGTGGTAEVDGGSPHAVGRLLATLCFAIVLAGVVLGITFIVASGFGKALSFEHIYPTLVDA